MSSDAKKPLVEAAGALFRRIRIRSFGVRAARFVESIKGLEIGGAAQGRLAYLALSLDFFCLLAGMAVVLIFVYWIF